MRIYVFTNRCSCVIITAIHNGRIPYAQIDPDFGLSRAEIESILDPKAFIGLAPKQTELFLARCVRPILDENAGVAVRAELNV